MESVTPSLWYWIILGFTALAFGVLGYLFGKLNRNPVPDPFDQLNILDIENAQLKADLDTCKKRLSANKPKGNPTDPVSPPPKAEPVPNPVEAKEFKALFGKAFKADDLKIVEGIGPKIEALFHQHDIRSWKQLSETSADRCQEILDAGGKRYQIHDPASWPMQAKMADQGKWKQLAQWQEEHRAGKY